MFDYMAYLAEHRHEQVLYCSDPETGLVALIAVHNTVLGPSLGGTRLWTYPEPSAALLDVLRLSEGMTYKAAVAGLPLGGGKAVILADGKEKDPVIRSARFRAFGRYIHSLGGKYITAEDVGTTISDMHDISISTPHVVGLAREKGGSGDPSPLTAYGVLHGIKAVAEDVFDRPHLQGLRVAIQGVGGKVGYALAEYLLVAGAEVVGTDINTKRLEEVQNKLHIQTVKPDAIFDVDCDIFSPCALGAIINDETIPRLKCRAIAGAANNQLAEVRHAKVLQDRGITYAVDYVINAGGLINVASEIDGYDEPDVRAKTENIYNTIKRLLNLAKSEHITTEAAAQHMAWDAINNGHSEHQQHHLVM